MKMREDAIWELRSDKVREELKKGIRLDGRKFDEFREIKIERDVSKNAHGSSRVFIGETRVIFGTKMDVGEPYPDTPDEGSITISIEFPALASPLFEVGPPQTEEIELSRVVDRGIREAKTIDFKKLCIEPAKKAWIVFIDGYIENDAGNIFDACGLAALIALKQTRIPKLDSEFKVNFKEFQGQLELNNTPIMLTFGKIGHNIIIDPSIAEEKALDARLTITTIEGNIISAMQKGLPGSFSKEEIEQCIDIAFEKAKDLRKLV